MGLPDRLDDRESVGQAGADTTLTPTVIEVARVTPAEVVLPEVASKAAVESLLKTPTSRVPRWQQQARESIQPVEACSCDHGQLVAGVRFHPVVAAIHLAFHDHRPLVLSPDILWLLMAQGFANHVNANAEELRSRFVQHTGKILIKVRRDDFVKGSPGNPWPEVFGAFAAQIREHIGRGDS